MSQISKFILKGQVFSPCLSFQCYWNKEVNQPSSDNGESEEKHPIWDSCN
jgi:hypothetical protein